MSRTLIPLTFVRGRQHASAPAQWLLLIDRYNDVFVEQLQMRAFAQILWMSQGHIQKDVDFIRLYFSANEQNSRAIVKGERKGWFLQRSGGCSHRLHDESCRLTVQMDKPRSMDDPVIPLLALWPKESESAQAAFDTCRFSQWPGGQHWYARLADGRDVEVDGESKWNNRELAQSAAIRFLQLPLTPQVPQ